MQAGNIDYLVADYLSEITMSLLTSAKHKSPVCITHNNDSPYMHCTCSGVHVHVCVLQVISMHLNRYTCTCMNKFALMMGHQLGTATCTCTCVYLYNNYMHKPHVQLNMFILCGITRYSSTVVVPL